MKGRDNLPGRAREVSHFSECWAEFPPYWTSNVSLVRLLGNTEVRACFAGSFSNFASSFQPYQIKKGIVLIIVNPAQTKAPAVQLFCLEAIKASSEIRIICFSQTFLQNCTILRPSSSAFNLAEFCKTLKGICALL